MKAHSMVISNGFSIFYNVLNNKTISFNKVFGESLKISTKIFYAYTENHFYKTGKIK